MTEFVTVTKAVFASNVGETTRLSKDQDCIDGGLVYIDQNDNIIGVLISGGDGEMEYYLVSETVNI